MIELMTILGILIIGPVGMIGLVILAACLIVKHVKKKRAEQKRLEEEAKHEESRAEFKRMFKELLSEEIEANKAKED